jgi:uncharacterized protein YecE (DUF72 family)
MDNLKIGTSGFLFSDWRGTVYPKKLQPEDTLFYYCDELGFNTVEINATYYTLLSDKAFESMERKTKSDFEFVVKAFRGITHNFFDPALVKYRPTLPQVNEYIDKFIYSLKPLEEKKKLGAVLLQFPVYFKPEKETIDYILMCKEHFKDIPLVVEFRNSGWSKPETFEFLRANKLANCVVDEPKLPKLMPFINETTADPGYIRFHGKNKNWFNSTRDERYNYFYNDEELDSFVPEIKKMQDASQKTYIFFNNCHAGSAVKNALRLKEILGFNIKEGKLF